MSQRQLRRPPRLDLPDPGDDPIILAAPPQQPEAIPASTSSAMIVMPVVAGSGSLLLTLVNRDRPLLAAAGVLFLFASVAVGLVMFLGTRTGVRRRLREQRERYLDHLEGVRRTVAATADAQIRRSRLAHPPPSTLQDIIRSPDRLWERRPTDGDFLRLRLGTGPAPLARPLSLSTDDGNPLIVYDPVCLASARLLLNRYRTLADQPATLPLARLGDITVVSDNRSPATNVARVIVSQADTWHSAEDLALIVVRPAARATEWDWAKWLPHCLAGPGFDDGPLDLRTVFTSPLEANTVLGPVIAERSAELAQRRGRPADVTERRYLVIVDRLDGEPDPEWITTGATHASLAAMGFHVLHLVPTRSTEPSRVDARITIAGRDAHLDILDPAVVDATPPGMTNAFTPDRVSSEELTRLARGLAGWRLGQPVAGGRAGATAAVTLGDVLGVPDIAELDVTSTWDRRTGRQLLRAAVGVSPDGVLVELDLKESAYGGMGPHGLVVGATGSGKSELLRTLLASLTIHHSPEVLALLLVDFKGGATFAGLQPLPHVAGLITNLQDHLDQVDRFGTALAGELQRRQQLLADAGNVPTIAAYHELRQTEPDREPLPHLVVVIDEFAELLAARPEFAQLFVAVGRIGRSIGVHLLLATQHLDTGRIRGIESHLSFRVALRTFSEAESREVIGTPDAYRLPPEPGTGYLKVDTSVYERFRSLLVTAPYVAPRQRAHTLVPVIPYTASNGLGALVAARSAALAQEDERRDEEQSRATHALGDRPVLEILVERIHDQAAAVPTGRPTRRVWLEPLPAVLTLDAVRATEDRLSTLSAPVGLLDIPERQRQEPLVLDFTGAAGNLLIVGAPQTGKSTALRTLLTSLSSQYAPGDIALYVLDFGGGSLAPLRRLPQVAAVAGRSDPELVRRTLATLCDALTEREQLFHALGIDSAAELRRRRGTDDAAAADLAGDLFLVIDGWTALRDSDDTVEEQVRDIANRGLSLGIHVIATIAADNQMRLNLATAFGGRLELHLQDPYDTRIDRDLATSLPADVPGRALLPGRHYAQIALPRTDGQSATERQGDALERLIDGVAQRWTTPVPPVQTLPASITLEELTAGITRQSRGLVLGIGERRLQPVILDLSGADPHLLVYGDTASGKSNLLHGMAGQLVHRHPAGEIGIVTIDYRRTHLGRLPDSHQIGYAGNAGQAAQLAQQLADGLSARLPGPDVTAEQLRDRSWWRGLEMYVLVDDYDLVASSAGNPLLPLVPYLAQGRDVGLHLVIARRTGGAGRAQFDPLIQALTDLGSPAVLFSGDRAEGRLAHGVTSAPLAPGRAQLARRGHPAEMVQTALVPPAGP